MAQPTIDKNIPIPKRRTKWPFADMEVGDSFFAPGFASDEFSGRTKHYAPKKFTVRTVIENGVRGVRVWRTA